MGLTNNSTGISVATEKLVIEKLSHNDRVIALAGNPNVGKSTVFNELTGLNQHTGNWPGKTVSNAQGEYIHHGNRFVLVDIPGTYSLMANSTEEEIARDFICFGDPDSIVVVTDATCLERNLNLVLQVLEARQNVVVCVNLLDEAKKKKINIDLSKLSKLLGVPVIGTSARSGTGLTELMNAVESVSYGHEETSRCYIHYDNEIERALHLIIPPLEAALAGRLDVRWVATKLLDLDEPLHHTLTEYLGIDLLKISEVTSVLSKAHDILQDSGTNPDFIRDRMVSQIVARAETIYNQCVSHSPTYNSRDRRLDKIFTSKATGIPVMLLMLGGIFWLTIVGANYPSELIASGLFWIEDRLTEFFTYLHAPSWLHGLLVLGMYRTLAWVVSVMLPPMAIFFPLFTLLEDSGYLPRVAFNMDKHFKKACAHGKQCLTMCMGFGCNACGVIGCRIIDSPRERLIAILTNNFVPCNGRFPTLIAIITMFFAASIASPFQSIVSTLLLTGVIVLGIYMTLLTSKLLSKTVLKGLPSAFALELPPYRRPKIGSVIVRSIFDRTLFVLGRAVSVAAPAGLVIWLFSNIHIGGISILKYCTEFLDPFAHLIGLDGVILMAFILGFPANEIVVPIIIMSYLSTGNIMELNNLTELHTLLVNNGWTWVTALCTMLFSLMHFPCATTCLTIKRETKSLKWTALSFLLPTVCGIVICFIVANLARLVYLII